MALEWRCSPFRYHITLWAPGKSRVCCLAACWTLASSHLTLMSAPSCATATTRLLFESADPLLAGGVAAPGRRMWSCPLDKIFTVGAFALAALIRAEVR